MFQIPALTMRICSRKHLTMFGPVVARWKTREIGVVAMLAYGLVTCTTVSWPTVGASAQERFRGILPDGLALPDELFRACTLQRSSLAVREIASNPDYSPLSAERVPGGWLVYDRWTDQVVELDDGLREVAKWGREGEGPLEYRPEPPGIGKTATGNVFVVENTAPASVIVFGSDSVEYQLDVEATNAVRIQHVLNAGNTFFITRKDGIFEATWGQRSVALMWHTARDLGLEVGPDGQPPRFKMRRDPGGTLYVAAITQSWIWSLNSGAAPSMVVRRCVPDAWSNVHSQAPRMEGSNPWRVSTDTMNDFLVLPDSQVLVLGKLEVGAQAHRSLEMYGADGALRAAWVLPISRANGVFDSDAPNRLLVWDAGEDDAGVRLIEVSGDAYPSG